MQFIYYFISEALQQRRSLISNLSHSCWIWKIPTAEDSDQRSSAFWDPINDKTNVSSEHTVSPKPAPVHQTIMNINCIFSDQLHICQQRHNTCKSNTHHRFPLSDAFNILLRNHRPSTSPYCKPICCDYPYMHSWLQTSQPIVPMIFSRCNIAYTQNPTTFGACKCDRIADFQASLQLQIRCNRRSSIPYLTKGDLTSLFIIPCSSINSLTTTNPFSPALLHLDHHDRQLSGSDSMQDRHLQRLRHQVSPLSLGRIFLHCLTARSLSWKDLNSSADCSNIRSLRRLRVPSSTHLLHMKRCVSCSALCCSAWGWSGRLGLLFWECFFHGFDNFYHHIEYLAGHHWP